MAKERITARARTQYTDYLVKEPMELMEFLAAKMPQASRTKLKMLLSKRVVFVDNVITTQYNFPLKLGMKVQISRDKGNKEFHNKLLKIVYEDAYLIVIEKMQGLLSVSTERQKERTACTILNEYLKRSGRNNRVYVVHRLDRDTSGLMMFAKDEKTQHTLRDNWHRIVFRPPICSRSSRRDGKRPGCRTFLAYRPQTIRILQSDGRWRKGSHHPLPDHQTGQRLFTRRTASGNWTEKPDPSPHARPGTSDYR